jgi:hypothetical protein
MGVPPEVFLAPSFDDIYRRDPLLSVKDSTRMANKSLQRRVDCRWYHRF